MPSAKIPITPNTPSKKVTVFQRFPDKLTPQYLAVIIRESTNYYLVTFTTDQRKQVKRLVNKGACSFIIKPL